MSNGTVIEVQDVNGLKRLIQSGTSVVVIDFWANWCGPCKKIAPVLGKIAMNNLNHYFCKVNVDDPDMDLLVREYNVAQLPTFLIFNQRKHPQRLVGSDAAALKSALAVAGCTV